MNPKRLLQIVERSFELLESGSLSRRQAAQATVGALIAAGARSSEAQVRPEAADEPLFQATELNHIALRVTDLDRSETFYRETLGLSTLSSSRSSRFMGCGPHFVALFRSDRPRMDHYAFSWPEYTQAEAARRLRGAGFEPRLSGNRIYFDDPDGHEIQISWNEDWPGRSARPGS